MSDHPLNTTFRRRDGIGLVELLIAMTILVVLLGIGASYLAQQSRATALSQATNDAEVTARAIAEAAVQDFQLSGSRATFVGGAVTYEPLNGTCTEADRQGCIVARRVASDGTIGAVPTGEQPNGYTVWYRTSLTPAPDECRRIDYAFVDGSLYRSDVSCATGVSTIDLAEALFATNVETFRVDFSCTDGTSSRFASDCYASGDPEDYVQFADVSIGVTVGGRTEVEADMDMRAYTPNLRPSVNYGRTE